MRVHAQTTEHACIDIAVHSGDILHRRRPVLQIEYDTASPLGDRACIYRVGNCFRYSCSFELTPVEVNWLY